MSEEERKFLEIVNLMKGFGSGESRQEVLKGMNFTVAKGEFCVLLGPSGSGKSTLLYALSGMDKPSMGKVFFGDKEIQDFSNDELAVFRRGNCGFVFHTHVYCHRHAIYLLCDRRYLFLNIRLIRN